MTLHERAMFIAKTFKVKTARDRAYWVTEAYKNKCAAEWTTFREVNRVRIGFEDTPCYRELKSLALDTCKELTAVQIQEIWRTAKKRFLQAVVGDLTILAAKDEAGSEFVEWDLPQIMSVNGIRRINGNDKHGFSQNYL